METDRPDIVKVVEDGVRIYRKNPILALPHVLSTILVLAFTAALLASAAFLAGYVKAMLDADDMGNAMLISIAGIIGIIILLLLGWIIIPSFFQAAAIKMSDSAIAGVRVDHHMAFSPDRERAIDLVMANIVVFIATFIITLVFIVLNIVLRAELGIFLAGGMGLSLMFYPYSIVLNGRGMISAMKEGFQVFWRNRLLIGILWIFIYNIGMVISSLSFIVVFLLMGASALAYLLVGGFSLFGLEAKFLAIGFGFGGFFAITIFTSAFVISPLKMLWETYMYRRLRFGQTD